jgi:hypothetical protein
LNRHDFQFEEFFVSEAVRLSFHGFDFFVCALQRAGWDRVIVVRLSPSQVEKMPSLWTLGPDSCPWEQFENGLKLSNNRSEEKIWAQKYFLPH